MTTTPLPPYSHTRLEPRAEDIVFRNMDYRFNEPATVLIHDDGTFDTRSVSYSHDSDGLYNWNGIARTHGTWATDESSGITTFTILYETHFDSFETGDHPTEWNTRGFWVGTTHDILTPLAETDELSFVPSWCPYEADKADSTVVYSERKQAELREKRARDRKEAEERRVQEEEERKQKEKTARNTRLAAAAARNRARKEAAARARGEQ